MDSNKEEDEPTVWKERAFTSIIGGNTQPLSSCRDSCQSCYISFVCSSIHSCCHLECVLHLSTIHMAMFMLDSHYGFPMLFLCHLPSNQVRAIFVRDLHARFYQNTRTFCSLVISD